jgi:hypothetical protein
MKSSDFTLEAAGDTIDQPNLHGAIDRYMHERESSIEDWQDQARIIMRYIKEQGGQPKTAKAPAGFTLDGQRAYLYRIMFVDLDGKEKWLAFEGEYGIAEITDAMPDPATFS